MFEWFAMLVALFSVRQATEGGVMHERVCLAIDLKSFYASVECRERGLDPLSTHLVVAEDRKSVV